MGKINLSNKHGNMVKDFMKDMLDLEWTLLDLHKGPWRNCLGKRVDFYLPTKTAESFMEKMNSRDSINEQFISITKHKLCIVGDCGALGGTDINS